MNLPKKYEERMKELLQNEYKEYIESFNNERYYGMRVNTLKITPDELEKITPFELNNIQWTSNGYYYNKDIQPAKHPHYFAGLYYIQEPSAMAPAEFLPINKGDKVLDLCAAPGGKSTGLGAKLQGTGLLVSNDVSATRAKALLKNIELSGITNVVITSEPAHKLAQYFEGYFDKILVDAPCSGEGMFRKEPSIMKNWEQYGTNYYNEIQKEIIVQAAKMLKPGGLLLYSTCTFSPEEDEGTIKYLLEYNDDFVIEELPEFENFDGGHPEWIDGSNELKKCVRIWPHKVKGEGHFVALLRKKESNNTISRLDYKIIRKNNIDEFKKFSKEYVKLIFNEELIEVHQEKVYLMPEGLPELKGLRILRAGWFLGEQKKNRFEPSQAFAMGLKKNEFNNIINFNNEQDVLIKYLKGETLHIEANKGWNLVCVDGYPLGWAKVSKGILKNKYHSGWRLM